MKHCTLSSLTVIAQPDLFEFEFLGGGGAKEKGEMGVELCLAVHCPFKTLLHVIYVDCSF